MPDNIYRLIHISDLHFSARPSLVNFFSGPRKVFDTQRKFSIKYPTTYNPNLAQAMARYFDGVGSSIDAIVMTGDLATTGLPVDLKIAHSFISEENIQSVVNGAKSRSLGKHRNRVFLLPGNHDRYQAVNFPPFWVPGSREFEPIFDSFWSPSKPGIQYKDLKGDGSVFLIAADFCLSSLAQVGGSAKKALAGC